MSTVKFLQPNVLKALLKAGFQESEIRPRPDEYQGKVLILYPSHVKPEYRTKTGLLCRANGGFGCSSKNAGRAVFATSLDNGEDARWDRLDFVAEYVGDLPGQVKTTEAAT